MIARVFTLLCGRISEKLHEAGILRAEAVAFHDARDGAIFDADWAAIEMRLTDAYVANWIETLGDTTQKGVPTVSTFRDTLEGVARMLDPLL